MKMPMLLPLLFFFSSAYASFNEFECKFRVNMDMAKIEIERASSEESMRTATLYIDSTKIKDFQVTSKNNRITRKIDFWGNDFDLEIQIWPHPDPRLGRVYRADFRTNSLAEGPYFKNVTCRYYGY